mgnify:CR=1 FL=1
MKELSIKVTIANRVYPLSIKVSEEENIRKAAKMINEMVKDFELNYAVKDKQDLLAMCALQYATQKLNLESNNAQVDKDTEHRLQKLNNNLSAYLAEH